MVNCAQVQQRRATIFADYNFFSTSRVDSLLQFVDCIGVGGRQLVKDIRSTVIPIEHSRVIIALGNTAQLDGYTDVTASMVAVVNAVMERYGAVNVQLYVLSLLPRPRADVEKMNVIKQQNTSLFKVVRSMIRCKQLPIQYVTTPKWFLKRVKHPNGDIQIEVDTIYYEDHEDVLNRNGQVHLHLLLAKLLNLKKICYEWDGMPLVIAKEVREVRRKGDRKPEQSKKKDVRQLKKGHGN